MTIRNCSAALALIGEPAAGGADFCSDMAHAGDVDSSKSMNTTCRIAHLPRQTPGSRNQIGCRRGFFRLSMLVFCACDHASNNGVKNARASRLRAPTHHAAI